MIIPNGYIYTSHTGSKYIFLEGCWFNNSTLQIIDISKYDRMNNCAIKQINESNLKNNIKIGKTYTYNNKNVVYIGEGVFKSSTGFLSETVLCEDSNTEVPIGYIIKSNKGNQYKKTNNGWLNLQTKKLLNSSASNPINQAAIREIETYNSTNNVKIGTKVKSKSGKEYTYVGGDRFVADDGKLIPKQNVQNILDRLSQTNTPPSNDSTNDDSTVDNSNTSDNNSTTQNNPQPQDSNDGNSSTIDALASRINSSPNKQKIEILLTRGDKVSLLAADILLAGTQEETLNILKSLK